MRPAIPFMVLLLAGCHSAGAADACGAVSEEDLGKVFGAKVTKAEPAGLQPAKGAVRSTCDFDFDNGDYLVVTLTEATTPRSKEADAGFGEPNSGLASRFSFPVIHEPGDKQLEALVSPTRDVNLRVGRAPAPPQEVERADEKLVETLAVVKF